VLIPAQEEIVGAPPIAQEQARATSEQKRRKKPKLRLPTQ